MYLLFGIISVYPNVGSDYILGRLKNDDTLTKLGDTFHYLLVVKQCLQMREGECVYVEKYGDISVTSANDSMQAEIKHHIDGSKLRDRDIDFWKTLRNWLRNFDEMTQFKSLILITTSSLDESSNLHAWNSKSAEERLKVLETIGSEKKKREQEFRALFNEVFGHEKSKITEIVRRMFIDCDQPNIVQFQDDLRQDPGLMNVHADDYDFYLNNLIGHIIRLPITPPHVWKITYEQFKDLAVETRNQLDNNQPAIPNIYALNRAPNPSTYHDETFVTEIKKISHDKFVPLAIDDYWRMMTTVRQFFKNNYAFSYALTAYKNNLGLELMFSRSNFEADSKGCDEPKRIAYSQKFYNDAMTVELKKVGKYQNEGFFQRGVIHDLVNDEVVKWYLEDTK